MPIAKDSGLTRPINLANTINTDVRIAPEVAANERKVATQYGQTRNNLVGADMDHVVTDQFASNKVAAPSEVLIIS